MTEQEVERMSNVDLLKEYSTGVFLGWPDGEQDYHIMRYEILSRMRAGISNQDEVPDHPDEYRR